MNNANYFDLSGNSMRIAWYPKGHGGPLKPGTQEGPVLVYDTGATEVVVSGAQLTICPSTPAGQFVVAKIKTSGIVPGAITSIGVLVPDVNVDDAPVPVNTFAVIAVHRGVGQLGPGQLETYTEINLSGTASDIVMPLSKET
jgi:hypothetical protein